jgi:HPt (histidine-containing phosphotransfer) domain-containing protein
MDDPDQGGTPVNANLTQALDRLWVRFLPEIEERMAVLSGACASAAQEILTEQEREAAHAAAHNLAGVLGTFGLARGTDLARELELGFSAASVIDRETAQRFAGAVEELRALIAIRKSAAATDTR